MDLEPGSYKGGRAKDSLSIPNYLRAMGRLSFFSSQLAAPALVAMALLSSGQAWAQGAGFETAPGSQTITSTGQPVIQVGPAAPASGVASQPNYGGFADATGGMYAPPLGYNAGAAQTAPVYSQPSQGGAPLTPAPGYSIQNAPTSGPYAAGPQVSPYPQAAYPLPQPYAFGAPMPDYAPQPSPYGPQPYPPQAYAQPQMYGAQPQIYAQQPLPYAAQTAPYAPAPQAMPRQPAQQAMPQQAQQPAAAYGTPATVPYASGTTAYGAVLPRNVANVAVAPMVEGGYTLGPGDKVKITVFNEPDLSGEYALDGNGNIRLPLIGMVRAAGYTAGALEGWIRAALQPNYVRNPRINVEITGYRPIYVVGAVVKPGQYTYINDMTLAQAVALAGGFTPQAKQSTVYLRHEGETDEQPVASGTPLLIRPGDTVRVDTTWFWDAMNFLGPLSSPVAIAATAAQ
jgi:polysaccharide export outer membrane protein